jgi:LysR family transcriptional regulator, regulator for metE and metH
MEIGFNHLKLVRAVADEGTLTRAGHRLHVTQPAVSHLLKDLEGRLGTAVFIRQRHRMVLTQAGERLLAAARAILPHLDQVAQDLDRLVGGRAGMLRIATQCYTCYHWLPQRVRALRQAFPDVDVDIVAEATANPYPYLLDGKIDLAVVHTKVADRRIAFRPLFRDELVMLVSKRHPLAMRKRVNVSDFSGQHVLHAVPAELNVFLQRVLTKARVSPRRVSHMQLTEALIEIVKADLGVAVLAQWAAAPHVVDGQLKSLRIGRRGIWREWSAALLRDRPREPFLRAFLNDLSALPNLNAEFQG